ncbi:hypothetical protein CAPTEDRAFT_202272 [Capitella teleta]|uniref:Uncharacterized protein n=1 Tax=Capitella teleta TaxID=283909 RepID=R7TH13_CAPTE|nr:hypothetical protein CAPTEDRAFT_202272 [Capitella teleta]|eukprot:ELT90395.1 hypothetical protein CAPTEDRAFT_202272 [Capitella teleta]
MSNKGETFSTRAALSLSHKSPRHPLTTADQYFRVNVRTSCLFPTPSFVFNTTYFPESGVCPVLAGSQIDVIHDTITRRSQHLSHRTRVIMCCRGNYLIPTPLALLLAAVMRSQISSVYAQSLQSAPWQGSQTYVAFPIEEGASYLDYVASGPVAQPARNRFEGIARQLSFAESQHCSALAADEQATPPSIIDNSDATSVGMLSTTSSISCFSSIEDLSIPDLVLPCDLSLTLPSLNMVSDDVCPLAIFDLSRIAPVKSATKRVLQGLHFGDSTSSDEIDVDAVSNDGEPRQGHRPPCIGRDEESTSSAGGVEKDPYMTTPQFHDSREKVSEWLNFCDVPSSNVIEAASESGLPVWWGESQSSTGSAWRNSGNRLVRCDSDSAVYLENSTRRPSTQKIRKPRSFLKTLRQVGKKLSKSGRHGNDRP